MREASLDGEQDGGSVLADRVDSEPPILRGCSSSELVALLAVAVALWIPLSIVLALALGKLPLALGFLAIGVIASVWFGSGAFQRIKRNRPDHYYVHAALRFLHLRKWWTSPFVWRSGWWDIGRG